MNLGRRTRFVLVAGLVTALSTMGAWSVIHEEPMIETGAMEKLLTQASVDGEEVAEWDLTVTRNERVESWIDFLQGRNRELTRLWLERSGKYAPMIQAELRSRGMPQDLLYLALIESGFSPRARSRAAAVGLWQFIDETARRYGLQVGPEVDERRDPIAATNAALDYLQDLYNRFGSWYLAAAAYNTGENRIDRILRERVGGRRGDDSLFWRIAPYLPQETRDYVPLMLAAGHIAKSPEDFGFEGLEYQEPLAFDAVWVPGETSLAGVARAVGVPAEEIEEMNAHLVRGRTPKGRGWSVRIPGGSTERFALHFPAIYQEERQQLARENARLAAAAAAKAKVATVKHRVRRGETLSHLAQRYGVTVGAIRAANDGIRPSSLRAGETLTVPTRKGGAEKSASASGSAVRYHRVKSGENLSTIAERYDVTVRQLQSWNGLGRRALIKAGQRLRVSG
jgi:membrane-bound lytic murein transglycosylase D